MLAILGLGVAATAVMIFLAAVGTAGGFLLCRYPNTRPMAPFAVLVPISAAIGGSLGSWWLGLISHGVENAPPEWSMLGWLSGLFAGGSLGVMAGCLLAALFSCAAWYLACRRVGPAHARKASG